MKDCKSYDEWCNEEKMTCRGCYFERRKEVKITMYEVTYSIDGILKKISINASDAVQAQNIFTNMYGNGKVQIINIRRV